MAIWEEIPPLRLHPRVKRDLDAMKDRLGVSRAKLLREIILQYLYPTGRRPDLANDDLLESVKEAQAAFSRSVPPSEADYGEDPD